MFKITKYKEQNAREYADSSVSGKANEVNVKAKVQRKVVSNRLDYELAQNTKTPDQLKGEFTVWMHNYISLVSNYCDAQTRQVALSMIP